MRLSHISVIIYIIPLFFIFTSCQTSVGISPSASQVGLSTLESVQETNPSLRLVYRLVSEKIFYPDGELVSEIVSSYNALARPLLIENKDAKGITQRVKSFVYDKNGADYVLSSAAGLVLTKGKLTFDDKGQLIEENIFNAAGKLQSSSKYSYDNNGNELVWIVLDGSSVVLSITEYRYQNNRVIESQVKDAGAKLVKSFIYSYDERGRLIEKKELDDKGKLSLIISQSYDNLILSREERNASGVLLRKRSIELDQAGNEVQSILYDARARVLEINRKIWQRIELSND